MSGTANIFRIPVAKVTETEAVERIVEMAKSPRSRSPFPVPRSPFFVATLNVDFVTNAVSGWPFGDRVTVFARYAYDILGSPFNKAYCNDGGYGVTRKLSCGNLIIGVRVPILLYHD